MATKVLMPQLGESVTEGTISKWLVKVGDIVSKYDPLAEVTTDKVNAEIPSTVAGRIAEIVVPEGETVAVGSLILYIEEKAVDESSGTMAAEPAAAPTGQTLAKTAEAKPLRANEPKLVFSLFDARTKQRYSPAVTRLAREHGIDLAGLTGTGAHGRVTRKDVLRYLEQSRAETVGEMAAPPASRALAAEVLDANANAAADEVIIPVTPARRTIANRLSQSKQEIPHAWMMIEVDVTNLVKLRNQLKDQVKQRDGVHLTYLPFFVKAVVESLKEYPMMNSTWSGDKIIVRKNLNISIAVGTEDVLYVPVIKNADRKSTLGIAKAIEELAERARTGKLTQEDVTGGTFTINNTGSFGSIQSMPIINYPQAAILSVESIVKRPVVINDMIAVRSMVNLCLSLDHRILDGLVCGRFLQSVKQKLESIGPETSIY